MTHFNSHAYACCRSLHAVCTCMPKGWMQSVHKHQPPAATADATQVRFAQVSSTTTLRWPTAATGWPSNKQQGAVTAPGSNIALAEHAQHTAQQYCSGWPARIQLAEACMVTTRGPVLKECGRQRMPAHYVYACKDPTSQVPICPCNHTPLAPQGQHFPVMQAQAHTVRHALLLLSSSNRTGHPVAPSPTVCKNFTYKARLPIYKAPTAPHHPKANNSQSPICISWPRSEYRISRQLLWHSMQQQKQTKHNVHHNSCFGSTQQGRQGIQKKKRKVDTVWCTCEQHSLAHRTIKGA